jgi:cellulose synthase/poly-beta-1,6-N-acetylglucosamine synthase-like glycosyltransferase
VAPTKPKPSSKTKLTYSLLALPIALSLLLWKLFPPLATQLSKTIFGYEPISQPPNWLWTTTITFYYTWFTFLAIGVGGLLVVGAWIARRKATTRPGNFYPMVSFVVPAFNEEKQIPRCIESLYKTGKHYPGSVEIIVVDDGSSDNTYEIAFASIQYHTKKNPRIRGKIIRHMANLGKVEALKTGINRALGQLTAIVDADSWWQPSTLEGLVKHLRANGKAAATGYIHPSDGGNGENPLVILQQLEYSQGLGVFRCAQTLGNAVSVVPGAIGVFYSEVLRNILNDQDMLSVAEDSEITLELQKRGYGIGYFSNTKSGTYAPATLKDFWHQRIRWFVGWLHNTLFIHRDILSTRSWLSLLLWYCLVVEYFGAFVEFSALLSFPFLFWFAPDRIMFLLNLFWFGSYSLAVGVVFQAVALRFAYGEWNHRRLLYYTPFYSILWFVNLMARLFSVLSYVVGFRGRWQTAKRAVGRFT